MIKSKAQKSKRVNNQTMIVTLDIGKGSHHGYFRAPDGQDVEPFAFYNTYESFHGFWKKLRVIADVIMLGHALRVVIPQGSSDHLRRLTQARERALKNRTAMHNQLQSLLFVNSPSALSPNEARSELS